jgi:hypothetical protein
VLPAGFWRLGLDQAEPAELPEVFMSYMPSIVTPCRGDPKPIMVHFNLMPAETLGFADKTFDTVVSTFTLCSGF